VDELLDALMASLADAVYLVGAHGEVQFANPAAVAMLGYAVDDELIGRDSHATIHSRRPNGEPFPEAECPLLRPRVSGEIVRVELDWFVRRDGTLVPVSYASAPVATAEGRGAVVVFRDESERLAAEAVAGSRARIVAASDAERRRIGRDLHDGAQQWLVRALMGIEEARRDPTRASSSLSDAAEAARRAIDELRDLAAGLYPLVLTDRGLAVALEDLTARSSVPVVLDVTEDRFAPEIEAAAYFIVTEALTNAAKHAHASAVEVSIAHVDDELRIAVVDDGVGGADAARGSGLRGLEDRVAVLGGSLDVVSGDGTALQATLPLRGSA
jgi:PAS domain S-box-containing protein